FTRAMLAGGGRNPRQNLGEKAKNQPRAVGFLQLVELGRIGFPIFTGFSTFPFQAHQSICAPS
ncbi:hypothetical protein M3616_23995, partial [Bacillus velezensis]